ncbi:MAG: dipeptidyl aminopeptidase [Betaproteobacteria bacterium]|nr:dipeptidyl aminopeptidase [Betaproteobacteria bacterium]
MKKIYLALYLATGCLFATTAISQDNQPPAWGPEMARVIVGASPYSSADITIPVQVFKPSKDQAGQTKEKWPVVIFSHGRSGSPASRAAQKNPVSLNVVRYWLSKGYAVVAAIRPGYGDNTSEDPEDHGARPGGSSCTGRADFDKTANAASHAVKAVHAWLISQNWVDQNHLLLVGQSVGGLATVAACAQNWPGVRGCINFAGGTGGNPNTSPGHSCRPDRLGAVLSNFAKTTKVPSLWLYSANDKYWGEEAPKVWFKAFTDAARAAGQTAPAEFFAAPPVGDDGHLLQNMGGRFWFPAVNAWLAQNGL